MPIYEFYCPDCHTIFNFLSKSINTTKRPHCPKCKGRKLRREVSSFALTGRAEEGDELVGVVSLSFAESSYKVSPFGWCDDLFVCSSHRGSGIGQRLMEAVAERARAADCSCVLLGVGVSEAQTQAFYRRLGYVDLDNKLFSLPL